MSTWRIQRWRSPFWFMARSGDASSAGAMDDEVGQPAQGLRRLAEVVERRRARSVELVAAALGLVETEQAGPGGLVVAGVGARRLADHLGFALHVQDVVADLEREAQAFGESGQRVVRLVARVRSESTRLN